MAFKILTWEEFREVCEMDASNWLDAGYTAEELTTEEILNEYPSEYFDIEEYQETDDLSSCFSPMEFATKTLEYMADLSLDMYAVKFTKGDEEKILTFRKDLDEAKECVKRWRDEYSGGLITVEKDGRIY